MEESEKRVMYKVWKTVNKMLKARGYNVVPGDLNLSKQEFDDKYGNIYESREMMPIMATKQHDETEAIFVFFPNDEKVAARTIQEMLGRMKRENVNRAIVVVKKEITNHAARSMNTMRPEFIFDVFHQNDLMVDIMEHVLVPQHVLLPEEEKKILLDRYSLKESQLPKIQTRDAVARYLGLEKGQVVKIIRNSETAGRYVTYRFVY